MDTRTDSQEIECRQVIEALSAHFDGVANEAEKQMATAHLTYCSVCSQMWSEWQTLRLMEQLALEPVASGEMLPLAPVNVPRHLKSAILHQTVSTPIWHRLWPRLLTGMAIPTFVLGCWLLIVATPWQQSISDMSSSETPTAENHIGMLPVGSASTPRNAIPKNSAKNIADGSKNSTKSNPLKSVVPLTLKNNTSSSPRRAEYRSDAPAIQRTKRMETANLNEHTTKSTFKQASRSETLVAMRPRISMASLDYPRSRAAKSVIKENLKPMRAVAPGLRATQPVLIAYVPTQNPSNSTDASSDPMLNYVAQNDVRPDDIRQAVENYRAAVLDDGSDL